MTDSPLKPKKNPQYEAYKVVDDRLKNHSDAIGHLIRESNKQRAAVEMLVEALKYQIGNQVFRDAIAAIEKKLKEA